MLPVNNILRNKVQLWAHQLMNNADLAMIILLKDRVLSSVT